MEAPFVTIGQIPSFFPKRNPSQTWTYLSSTLRLISLPPNELSLNKEETCLLKKLHAQWLAEYIP